MQAKLIPFHELCDHRGRLIFLEEGGGCPFEIGEVHWLKPMDGGVQPAEWVATGRPELLVALRGEVDVRLSDASGEADARLDAPHAGVLVEDGMRCFVRFLNPSGTVLRLIASKP